VTEPGQRRKLSAILSADVVGYSKLMADDEAATVDTIKQYRVAVGHVIERRKGRIVNAPGDNILAEFASAVEAVQAAVEIQRSIEGRNVELPEERRMHFRIGLNLGDVIEEDDGTIYGDGVNIAARMETLADEGGICISSTIHDAVDGKLDFGFDFLGERPVKNIEKPVRVYRVRGEPREKPKKPRASKNSKLSLIVTSGVFVVAIASIIIWQIGHGPTTEQTETADPVLALPTGPSIAVLPFKNMSGEVEEEYFADGLTGDLITELARFRELQVRARNTTAQYKGQAVDVSQVGRDLGVRYVLEGSVRRIDDRIRINVNLVETATDNSLWVDRYDRELTDIFAVQDEITSKVIGVIASGAGSVLRIAEAEKSKRKPPEDLEAYDLVLRARAKPSWMAEDYLVVKALLERALALQPDYAQAREAYAWTLLMGWIFRFETSQVPPAEIKENALRALELYPGDALTRRTAAYGYLFDRQLDLFRRHADRALEMAPNNAEILAPLGMAYSFIGEWDKGLAVVDKARVLNAVSAAGWYNSAWFYPLYLQGRYKEAIDMIRDHPLQGQTETLMKYTMVYGQLGDQAQAMEYWRRCQEVEPDWSAQRMIDIFALWNFPEDHTAQFMEGVWKAGIPKPAS